MFTVMHRHDSGAETLYRAAVVTRDPGKNGAVVLRGCPDSDHHGPGAIIPTPGMIQIAAGARSSGGLGPMVFVMNEAGATVARHYL